MTDILTLDGHPYRPIVQCEPPKEVTDMCVRYAFTDGECCLHGCVGCPATLYNKFLNVPVINLDAMTVADETVKFQRGIMAGVLAIIAFGFLGGAALKVGAENAHRVNIENQEP